MKTTAAALLQGALGGVSLLLTRFLGPGIHPIFYALSYLLTANLMLFAYTLWGDRQALRAALPLWRRWLAVGMVNAGIQMCTVTGVALSGATNASVLLRTDLIFGLVLGWAIYRESARWAELLGGGLMVWGVLLVMRISLADFSSLAAGDLLLILGGLLTAVNALIIKYGLASMKGSAIATCNTLVAGLTLTLVFTFSGGWQALPPIQPSLVGWISISGVCYALTLILYYYALSRIPIYLTRLFTLVSPVVALIGGWALFGEMLTLSQLGGVALVMVGMTCMLTYRAKHAPRRKAWVPHHAGVA